MKVRVGKTRSVKMAEYQYFKPEISLEVEIADSDAGEDKVEDLVGQLSIEIDNLLDGLVRMERERRKVEVEIAELQEVLEDTSPNSAQYKLAKKRLQELEII